METDPQTPQETHCCKVSRVLQRYDLEHLDREIQLQWSGENGESASLRELAREVNRELLGAALADAGVSPIDGEAENLRRIFREDDVSENRQIEARRRLERDGVAVAELLGAFVSHQTIHNHLRNCQGVTTSKNTTTRDRLEAARSTVFGLQSRTETVTEQTLAQLADRDQLSPAEFDVVVDIQAICEDCGRSYSIETLLSDGGCTCTQYTDSK